MSERSVAIGTLIFSRVHILVLKLYIDYGRCCRKNPTWIIIIQPIIMHENWIKIDYNSRHIFAKRKSKLMCSFPWDHSQPMPASIPSFRLERSNRLPSWKSLLFYRCTDTILFAPLKLQGINSHLDHIHQKTMVAAPPPCLLKSVYILVNLVNWSSHESLSHETNTIKSS